MRWHFLPLHNTSAENKWNNTSPLWRSTESIIYLLVFVWDVKDFDESVLWWNRQFLKNVLSVIHQSIFIQVVLSVTQFAPYERLTHPYKNVSLKCLCCRRVSCWSNSSTSPNYTSVLKFFLLLLKVSSGRWVSCYLDELDLAFNLLIF